MPTWDELYADPTVAPEDPHPFVERLIGGLKETGAWRVLDLGCGGGRHLVRLGVEGIRASGIDASPRGLRQSRGRLDVAGLDAGLALADFGSLPFSDAVFDAVISVHVLYHASRAGMQRAMREVARVLPERGLFAVTLLSTRTWKYGEGDELEPLTYVQPRGPEAGVPHHYCDEDEARSLLDGFDIDSLALDEYEDVEGNRHSHWEIVAHRR